MKYLLIAVVIIAMGCEPTHPNTAHSESTVFGKCRFCGKPGYSSVQYMNTSLAQERADAGDKSITGAIVCGTCRKGMEEQK